MVSMLHEDEDSCRACQVAKMEKKAMRKTTIKLVKVGID